MFAPDAFLSDFEALSKLLASAEAQVRGARTMAGRTGGGWRSSGPLAQRCCIAARATPARHGQTGPRTHSHSCTHTPGAPGAGERRRRWEQQQQRRRDARRRRPLRASACEGRAAARCALTPACMHLHKTACDHKRLHVVLQNPVPELTRKVAPTQARVWKQRPRRPAAAAAASAAQPRRQTTRPTQRWTRTTDGRCLGEQLAARGRPGFHSCMQIHAAPHHSPCSPPCRPMQAPCVQ